MSGNRLTKLIGTILIAVFFIGGLPWRELLADAQTHSEYNCSLFTVVYDQTSSWDNTTQAQFTVTNSSADLIESWSFEIVFSSDVFLTNLWNAQNLSDENTSANTLVIGNEVYNSCVAPGESVTFGITISGNEFAPVAPIAVYLVTESQSEITPTPTPVEEETPFPYAVFADSSETDLFISGWRSTLTGDVYSGNNFIYQGSELYVDGTVRTVGTIQPSGWTTSMSGSEETAAPRQMPDWNDAIISKTVAMTTLDASAFTSQNDIIVNGYFNTDDSITINCASFSGTVFIVANGDITVNADSITGEGAVILYSKTGNITINSTNATVNGILYAPNGRISLSGNDISVNGRLVANEFGYSGSTLTVTADAEDLWFLEDNPDITPTTVPTITPEPTTEPTATPTAEPTITEQPTPSVTVIPTSTEEPIATPTSTLTPTATPTEVVATATPTATLGPTVTVTATPTATNTPTSTPIITVLPTPTITDVPTPTITDTPVPTPTITDDDYDLTDSDSDGLLDYVEDMLGTDINNPDTDGDGLLDGDEMNVETNPFFTDSDMDGLSDFEEDYDGDGLTNGQEYGTNTCMFLYDTDFDGINDYDELYVYGTDPRNEDSDSDGITDGDELILGLTPGSIDSDGDGITDDYETFPQSLSLDITTDDHPQSVTSVEISGSISGLITSNTTLEDVYNLDYYCTDVVGLVGVPISIESTGHFDSMTLTFHYDESELGETSEDDLGVLWFDDSTGFFVVQEQAQIDKDNNVITVELCHFSTYMLVDLSVWNNIEPIHYNIPTQENNCDYIIALDMTSIMSDASRIREIEAYQDIVNNTRSGDRICVFVFSQKAYLRGIVSADDEAGLNSLSEDVINLLQNYSVEGNYCSYYLAFSAAYDIITGRMTDIGNDRILCILSSDTDCVLTSDYTANMNYYKLSAGFSANFVMLEPGDETTRNFGWQYAEATGSNYYKYPLYQNLSTLIATNYTTITEPETDSDGDGIPDYIEEQGMMATNGRKITSNPNETDSDGDTISDTEEDGIIYTICRSSDSSTIIIYFEGAVVFTSQSGSIPEDSQYYPLHVAANQVQPGTDVRVCFPESDSEKLDSDNDGFADYEDARPNVVNPDMIYVLSNPDFEDEGRSKAIIYCKSGYNVCFRVFNSITSFNFIWDRIGLYDKTLLKDKLYGDRYYYNPKYVVICSHGNSGGFCIGSNSTTCDRMRTNNYSPNNPAFQFTTSSALPDKKIESLNLYCCFAGGCYSNGYNIAEDFLDCMEGIQQVIAPDSYLWTVGNYMYFADYSDIHYVSPPEYESYCNFRQDDTTNLRYINCTNIIDRVSVYGFLLFTDANNDPIDYYSSDVIYGTLYTRNDVYPYNHGILAFVPPVKEQLSSYIFNDPVLNRGVI